MSEPGGAWIPHASPCGITPTYRQERVGGDERLLLTPSIHDRRPTGPQLQVRLAVGHIVFLVLPDATDKSGQLIHGEGEAPGILR